MDKEREIAEMVEIFRVANKNANVEPVFENENGEEHYLPQEAIKVIENILDTLFIPLLASVAIEAGYRKADEVRKETAKEIFKEVVKLLDEAVPHTKEFTTLLWLAGQIKTKYGVEVDE